MQPGRTPPAVGRPSDRGRGTPGHPSWTTHHRPGTPVGRTTIPDPTAAATCTADRDRGVSTPSGATRPVTPTDMAAAVAALAAVVEDDAVWLAAERRRAYALGYADAVTACQEATAAADLDRDRWAGYDTTGQTYVVLGADTPTTRYVPMVEQRLTHRTTTSPTAPTRTHPPSEGTP